MAQVDFKVTAWERVEIKDEYVKEVIEKSITVRLVHPMI
jgi:hypothetical protein